MLRVLHPWEILELRASNIGASLQEHDFRLFATIRDGELFAYLLKKSASNSTAEKYVGEIEIWVFGYRAQGSDFHAAARRRYVFIRQHLRVTG